jgi:chromosome segregation ATPase
MRLKYPWMSKKLGLLIDDMRFYSFIIILSLLWGASEATAQVVQGPSSMPEQWQLTLDVIKSKAQTLMVENNGLQSEYRQLIGQVQRLQQVIDDQQNKNGQISILLKERRGRTDQQLRMDELAQAGKTKRQEIHAFEEQFKNLEKKQVDLGHTIQQLKDTISGIEFHQQAEKKEARISQNPGAQEDELTPWRKQLEDDNRQEVLLENEWRNLKTGAQMKNLNVDALEEENKQLEARLNILQLQKLQHIRKSSDMVLAQANARRYDQLRKRKDELETSINAYESRLDELRQSSLLALSWPAKKKKLIHDMVQVDARNNQMRDNIKVLREDIDVLRDQVARLERRVDFVQGKDINNGPASKLLRPSGGSS